jgi:cytochrome c oxidase subunit 4
MNTATVSEDEAHQEHSDHGLSDVGYIKIAAILAILTGVEVATYFFDFGVVEIPSLLILMVVKFQIVVSYFMHLKFDSKVFSYLFVTGLILAMLVFAAMGTSMAFWQDPSGCDASTFC